MTYNKGALKLVELVEGRVNVTSTSDNCAMMVHELIIMDALMIEFKSKDLVSDEKIFIFK